MKLASLAIALAASAAVLATIQARGPAPGQAAPAGAIRAFTGARLIDGTTADVVPNATILVQNGRIVDVGPSSRVKPPAGADTVSLAGKTVIPGLVNAHGHVGDTEGLEGNHYSAANVARDLETYATYGVTTVVSLGGDQQAGFDARAAQNTAALNRSRIYVAGPVLSPSSPEDARRLVDEDAAMHVDIVKIRVDDNLGTTKKMAPEIYRAVIDESHKKGLRTAVHLFYLSDAKAVLAAGADFIAHSIRDQEVDGDVIAALKARGVCVCPTLMREVSTFVYETTPAFFADPLFLKRADARTVAALRAPAYQDAMAKSRSAQLYKAGLDIASANLKKLSDAGVTIAMGTDSGPPARFQGYFELMELEMMAKAGLTPRQVLASATRDAARCMKLDKDLGTLERGKWADFIALDADPLASISNVKKMSGVWIAGNAVGR